MKVIWLRHISCRNAELIETPSGERIAILVGRHEKHGSSLHHTVALVQLAPGQSSDNHFHRISEESYIIVRGCGRIRIDGKDSKIAPNDLIHTMPGESHQFFNEGEDVLEYFVITAPRWTPEDSYKP